MNDVLQDWVVVTGALGGIGAAICQQLRTAGFHVLAVDRAPEAGDVECSAYLPIDLQRFVVDEEYRSESVRRLDGTVGTAGVRGLVNNAAVQILGTVRELTVQDWRDTLEVNLLAPFFMTQALVEPLDKSGGSVVNISSIHASQSKMGFAAYAASKAGLTGMTRSLALELGDRIRVNCIEPAAIDTAMLREGLGSDEAMRQLTNYHPCGSIGSPHEVAELVQFLLEFPGRFLNGAAIPIDGGIRGRLHDPF